MTAQLRKYRWFGALVGLWLTIGNAPVWALTVESTGDSGGICPGATCTLRQAIVDTPSGGTVDFNMPLPNVIELVSEQLTLNKNLTIIGPGADQLAIYGNLRFRVMEVTEGVTVNISGLRISRGVSNKGAGIFNQGTLTVSNSTISDNFVRNATSLLDGGAGIFNEGTLTVSNSSFHLNDSVLFGGGIANFNGTVTVSNSTFSGNFANNGGGISNFNGTVTVSNSTFSGNSVYNGSGNSIYSIGQVNIRGTIIANNPSVDNCAPFMVTSQGDNISSDGTCFATSIPLNDRSSINPLLSEWANNGGPTRTYALQNGSPALNAVKVNTCPPPATDQRGVARPAGPFCDIGAFESTIAEIAVTGNSQNIVDGDNTPDLADHTDFGVVLVAGGTVVRTFTIASNGHANLSLGSVTVGGTHAADFTVSLAPTSPVAAGGSTTFQVTFDPSAAGLREATLSFSNNDSDENPFNFAIAGTGYETDLAITNTDGVTTAAAAASTTYTIVASNAGPLAVAIATVADTFPTACTSVSYSSVAAGGASGNTLSGLGNIRDAALSLPVGSSVTYTAICTIGQAATGSLVNTASISSEVADPIPGNNSATDTDTLTALSRPVAVHDSVVAAMNTSIPIAVLDNDDPASDFNRQTVNVKRPFRRGIHYRRDGKVQFRPRTDSTTPELFNYTFRDTNGKLSNIATVTVNFDTAPAVIGISPSNGASNVGIGRSIGILFNEEVTVSAASFQIACSRSGVHSYSPDFSGVDVLYILDSDNNFVNGEICTVTVRATEVNDLDGIAPPNMRANFISTFRTVP